MDGGDVPFAQYPVMLSTSQEPSQSSIDRPSFSLIVETENLANADLDGLVHSLQSIAQQQISPERANEVLMIESGDTPPELLAQLCDRYPWLRVERVPADTGYYKAKMLGAAIATGEVVVYCDSDCVYEPNWLEQMLCPFAQAEVQVVAGETKTRGTGPYGLAMAIVYIFPQYSGQSALAPTSQYFLNNVAFRRSFLLHQAIPLSLPLYRGNCVIHAREILHQGTMIWRQPLARATHAPPDGLSHFFWRFLLIGHDYYWQQHLLTQGVAPSQPDGVFRESGLQGKLQVLDERVGQLFRQSPHNWLYLPLAVPIVLLAVALIAAGYWITRFQPRYLLMTYDRLLNEA